MKVNVKKMTNYFLCINKLSFSNSIMNNLMVLVEGADIVKFNTVLLQNSISLEAAERWKNSFKKNHSQQSE